MENRLSSQAREIIEYGLEANHNRDLEVSPHLTELAKVIYNVPEKPEDFDVNEINFINPNRDLGMLVSGGLDSTVAYLMASRSKVFEDIYAFYCDMGQNYAKKEIAALDDMGIEYEVIQTPSISGVNKGNWKHIQPGRNFLYLALVAEQLPRGGEVWLGAVDGEISQDGGDKSWEFFDKLDEILQTMPYPVYLRTPISKMTKGELVKWAVENDELETVKKTISCFSGGDGRCGECQSCLRTFLAFAWNDVEIEFNKHPMEHAQQFVEKYKTKFAECLLKNDFSHYSKKRVEQDLEVITLWERENG